MRTSKNKNKVVEEDTVIERYQERGIEVIARQDTFASDKFIIELRRSSSTQGGMHYSIARIPKEPKEAPISERHEDVIELYDGISLTREQARHLYSQFSWDQRCFSGVRKALNSAFYTRNWFYTPMVGGIPCPNCGKGDYPIDDE